MNYLNYKKPMKAWGSELKIVNCENFNNGSYKLYILPKVNQKINLLMKEISVEWAAYLIGNIVHSKKVAYITDLILPLSQYNTVGNVDDIVMDQNHTYIGVIHSHHTMGAFFSGPDDQTVNKNHNISIVVSSNKGKSIASVVRGRTKCGSMTLDEEPIIRKWDTASVNFDVNVFLSEIDEKIPHKKSSDIKVTELYCGDKNEFQGYGLPIYNNIYNNKNNNNDLDEDDDAFIRRYMGGRYYNEQTPIYENISDEDLTYSAIINKIKTDTEFKTFVFKELVNDKSLLKTFRDVIIANMYKLGIIKNTKKKVSTATKKFIERINKRNEEMGISKPYFH